MILIHDSLGGLPEFVEIIQMVILQCNLVFIAKKIRRWYIEHYQAYDLKTLSGKEFELTELQDKIHTHLQTTKFEECTLSH